MLEQKTDKSISKGNSSLLGATPGKNGVNFSIYSKNAIQVFLLLFDSPIGEPIDIIKLIKSSDNIWSIFVNEIRKGQLYGYKVQGPHAPRDGMRCNENKLLVDPYAKAITHEFKNEDNLLLGYDVNSDEKDLSYDVRDNTAIVPK